MKSLVETLRTNRALAALSVFVLLVASGCATSTLTTGQPLSAQSHPAAPTVAVVPFENLSHQRHAGLVLTDLATTVLHAQRHFRVLEISAAQQSDAPPLRALDTAPWEKQIGVNTTTALAVGRQLHADFVLAGSVGEYGFVDGFGETANVGLNVRLVRVETGEVVWVGSLSRRIGTVAFDEESVHRLAHGIVIDLVNRMDAELCGQHPLHNQMLFAPHRPRK